MGVKKRAVNENSVAFAGYGESGITPGGANVGDDAASGGKSNLLYMLRTLARLEKPLIAVCLCQVPALALTPYLGTLLMSYTLRGVAEGARPAVFITRISVLALLILLCGAFSRYANCRTTELSGKAWIHLAVGIYGKSITTDYVNTEGAAGQDLRSRAEEYISSNTQHRGADTFVQAFIQLLTSQH